jgi:hypothetical protein
MMRCSSGERAARAGCGAGGKRAAEGALEEDEEEEEEESKAEPCRRFMVGLWLGACASLLALARAAAGLCGGVQIVV